MRLLQSAASYFALVFGAGFLFGVPRTLLLVPRVGARAAELMELPLMLGVIVLAARWINRRFPEASPTARLGAGFLALAFLLLAEMAAGMALRGLSPGQALLNRDPVSGTAYYVLLGVFAVAPRFLVDQRG